jgi:hypothetical protein
VTADSPGAQVTWAGLHAVAKHALLIESH